MTLAILLTQGHTGYSDLPIDGSPRASRNDSKSNVATTITDVPPLIILAQGPNSQMGTLKQKPAIWQVSGDKIPL
jgi:hypothetical protein